MRKGTKRSSKATQSLTLGASNQLRSRNRSFREGEVATDRYNRTTIIMILITKTRMQKIKSLSTLKMICLVFRVLQWVESPRILILLGSSDKIVLGVESLN